MKITFYCETCKKKLKNDVEHDRCYEANHTIRAAGMFVLHPDEELYVKYPYLASIAKTSTALTSTAITSTAITSATMRSVLPTKISNAIQSKAEEKTASILC